MKIVFLLIAILSLTACQQIEHDWRYAVILLPSRDKEPEEFKRVQKLLLELGKFGFWEDGDDDTQHAGLYVHLRGVIDDDEREAYERLVFEYPDILGGKE